MSKNGLDQFAYFVLLIVLALFAIRYLPMVLVVVGIVASCVVIISTLSSLILAARINRKQEKNE